MERGRFGRVRGAIERIISRRRSVPEASVLKPDSSKAGTIISLIDFKALEEQRDRPSPLATELATFNARRQELVAGSDGQYVLIKGEEILGTFPNQMAAVNEGYERLGNVPFFTREIRKVDRAPLSLGFPSIEIPAF